MINRLHIKHTPENIDFIQLVGLVLYKETTFGLLKCVACDTEVGCNKRSIKAQITDYCTFSKGWMKFCRNEKLLMLI